MSCQMTKPNCSSPPVGPGASGAIAPDEPGAVTAPTPAGGPAGGGAGVLSTRLAWKSGSWLGTCCSTPSITQSMLTMTEAGGPVVTTRGSVAQSLASAASLASPE